MKRRPTIIDVANHIGVSKSTVSRVIRGDVERVSEATRRLVEEAVVELGYERNDVASSLRTERTNTIMLAIPDIANPFWPDLARGVQDVMDRQGIAVVFANSDWDARREQEFLRMASRNRFDGLLINPTAIDNDALCTFKIPAVLIGSHEGYPDFDTIGSDSYNATRLALDHLVGLGHRRIALIRGQRQSKRTHARLHGFLDYGKEKGLPLQQECVVEVPYDFEGGRTGLRQLLDCADPPTAILAANDILALGALQEAHDRDIAVPRDLSIVGMDDIFAAATTTPPLTTVAKPKYDIGRKAAELLLQRIEGHDGPRQRYIFACTLHRRSSTAAPREAVLVEGSQ